MKTRIIAFLLVIITVVSLVSCGKDEKKKVVDLSQFVVADNGRVTVTAATYAFFLYEYVSQYSYYLSWYGYDTSVSLTKQTTMCAFDTTKTWFEYFDEVTRDAVLQCVAFATAAIDEGMSLSAEELADLDEYMKQTEEEAYKQGYDGIEGLIASYFVEGISAKAFRECMELQQLAYSYVQKIAEEINGTDFDSATLEKVLNDNKSDFYGIDYINYAFFPSYSAGATEEEKQAAYAEAKRKAEEFLATYPDAESMKNAIVELENEGLDEPYAPEVILADYIAEHELMTIADDDTEQDKAYHAWAYSADRKAGDTYIREFKHEGTDTYYSVNCIIKPAYIEDYITKTVRHIYFEVNDDLTGEELEAEEIKVHAKANEVYDIYKNGEMTSESFAELAKEYSQDANNEQGGIYENVRLGDMVEEFDSWIYDPARKPGDTEIIRTSYGYHIMFFESDGLRAWELDALDIHKDELYNQRIDELVQKYTVVFDTEAIKNIP